MYQYLPNTAYLSVQIRDIVIGRGLPQQVPVYLPGLPGLPAVSRVCMYVLYSERYFYASLLLAFLGSIEVTAI